MPQFKSFMKWVFGLLFVAAGTNHFLQPALYEAIMPPYLPWPVALVYLSGMFEVVLGVLLLIPRTTTLAAWGLIALLIAMFPANLHMALNADSYPAIPPVALWLRLPVQGLLIAWAWWFTGKAPSLSSENSTAA